MEMAELATIAAVGLAAGVLGGMLGVGGSIVMIPALVYMYGQGAVEPGAFGTREHFDQHLYQAAAMGVNVAVAVPATWRHAQAGAVMGSVLRWMLPAAIVTILVGVAVSNLEVFRGGRGPVWLGRLLAVFLVYVIAVNVRRLWKGRTPGVRGAAPRGLGEEGAADQEGAAERATPGGSTAVGGVMGFVAGLLGIGGGAIAVPLQQMVLRLPLRSCIANSAAVMCVSAGIGAVYKNATLPDGALVPSLTIMALLAPTALVGGFIGGRLTHVLPLTTVRVVWVLLLIAAAWKMAAL